MAYNDEKNRFIAKIEVAPEQAADQGCHDQHEVAGKYMDTGIENQS